MAETVLVSGGSGFIAGWCIVQLLERGYTVRTTVRSLAKEAAVRAAISSKVDAGDRLSFFAAELQFGDGRLRFCFGWRSASRPGSSLRGEKLRRPS